MAQMKFDPAKPYNDLATILGQIESAKDVDRESRVQAKMWEGIAERFDEALTGSSHDEGRRGKAALFHKAADGLTGLADAAALSRKIAERLNPVEEVSWTQEQLEDLVVAVRFFLGAGAYEGGEVVQAQEMIAKASVLTRKGGSGVRGEGRVIDGRPEYVQVLSLVGDEPVQITHQRGNKESAPGNIYKSVSGWLESHDVAVTDEMAQAIKDAIGQCVRENIPVVKIGDFAVIQHASAPAA